MCPCLGAAAGLLGGRLHAASRCFTLGSAGIGPALGAARELLSRGAAQCVLIAAVDSWLSTPCIQQALQAERLLSSDKGDGFLPGEAASAILLEAGVHVIEHLTALERVPVRGARFTAVPPRVEGFGTFPVRAFAAIDEG